VVVLCGTVVVLCGTVVVDRGTVVGAEVEVVVSSGGGGGGKSQLVDPVVVVVVAGGGASTVVVVVVARNVVVEVAGVVVVAELAAVWTVVVGPRWAVMLAYPASTAWTEADAVPELARVAIATARRPVAVAPLQCLTDPATDAPLFEAIPAPHREYRHPARVT
jgi:hypothetical protein